MSKEKQIENIKKLLTGNRKSDRIFIFKRMMASLNNGDQATLEDLMRLAVSYLPNDYHDLQDEFEHYEEAYTASFLTITAFEDIGIMKRLSIMSFLIKYTEYKEEKDKNENSQLYSFDFDLQAKIFDKLTGGRIEYNASDYPYALIYFQYANLLSEYGDNASAYAMFSKAHVFNPMSGPILARILMLFKQSRQSEELLRLSQWLLNVSFDPKFIGLAMQFMGYGLYLDGKFEESYACYFQSLKYDHNPFPGLNDEVNGVLTAMHLKAPYSLSKVEIGNLFIGKQYKPSPNEVVFDVIREHLIVEFTKQNYTEVLAYVDTYLRIRPRDSKIITIQKKAIEALN